MHRTAPGQTLSGNASSLVGKGDAMDFKDYYKILGVEPGADDATIKAAYRKLARKYHPDVSKEADAMARMAEINEANAVLSDPEKREAYDALGRQAPHRPGQDFHPPPNWDAGFEFSDGAGAAGGPDGEFSDFFEQLFGRRARAQRARSQHRETPGDTPWGGTAPPLARQRSPRQDRARSAGRLPGRRAQPGAARRKAGRDGPHGP